MKLGHYITGPWQSLYKCWHLDITREYIFRILNSRNLFGESLATETDDIKYKSYGNVGGRSRSRRDRDPLSGYASSASYLQGRSPPTINALIFFVS